MSGTLIPMSTGGWYPSEFQNLWYRWVLDNEKISEVGYRLVTGTEER